MNKLIDMQKKLIPQVVELMERRYSILRQISLSEPIGRRTLSNMLDISERIIRSETEVLKEQNLINVAGSGMTVTEEGLELLDELKDVMNDVMGLSKLQQRVKEKLGIKKVIVVPGNFEKNESLLKDVAKSGAEYFLSILKDSNVVSVTGGSTMLEFASSLKSDKKYNQTTIVPARGGVGKDVETQSNNIVAILGKKLGAHYKLLNVPDELGAEAMKTLSLEPEINKTLNYIVNTDILVFGIGRADEMAKRRKLPKSQVEEILSKGAVGEAFGYYFNKNGEIVCELNTVGIKLETFKSVKNNIAIFAGSSKAEAVTAISKINQNMVIVTDEESAYKILEIN
ncbi:sugar-binding transcriptional regulator [Paraclostridium sordellii]|uniref:sugar-binding transcriptional regulator n=1 Tax=Paraclostridium sordellii TaxID=1505 RepID=UPI0005E50C26|nr:sugar-binding domain-containing protein [Paeniclostridium sordellii]MDU6114303.1 sugar-binding domain-containing protein [Paeniclostridium sordellii]MDU7965541.1 sugar-binding domain-containing protein [Paeniclostridium sordellii]MRZ81315.1 transcriptional regulator [Paeniclostridium sordellii]MSB57402.1 transcriptional regulator [Paeniclostridium sordellii]CEO13480.1 SorC family transcriptional regulator [[Clostridium] sordellii] [Paeniclostridium sordellii]